VVKGKRPEKLPPKSWGYQITSGVTVVAAGKAAK
jgi:hypothetical protein